MIPENRIPTHPGEILLEEFLRPLGLTQSSFARHIGVSAQCISEIVQKKRRITPKIAWLLAQALGTTPEFWINLQSVYDLAKNRPKRHIKRLEKAMPVSV